MAGALEHGGSAAAAAGYVALEGRAGIGVALGNVQGAAVQILVVFRVGDGGRKHQSQLQRWRKDYEPLHIRIMW